MVGFMNEEAFRRTVETGYATFYSRSRKKLWLKGETSGHRPAEPFAAPGYEGHASRQIKELATHCDLPDAKMTFGQSYP